MTDPTGDYRRPSSTPVFQSVLRWGLILAVAIAVVGGVVGFLAAGTPGLVSALIGALIGGLFLGVTAASILFANRLSRGDMLHPAYFGVILGAWLLKFVLFLVIVFLLREQPWIDGTVLFLTLVAGVLGTLAIDVIVVARSRIPYASDVTLPGDGDRR
jgi:drug/metabolite transporter (DMT)-like permease